MLLASELIKNLPDLPHKPILFVVYDESAIPGIRKAISGIKGSPYLEKNVTFATFEGDYEYDKSIDYSIYIDPQVFLYKHSWNT